MPTASAECQCLLEPPDAAADLSMLRSRATTPQRRSAATISVRRGKEQLRAAERVERDAASGGARRFVESRRERPDGPARPAALVVDDRPSTPSRSRNAAGVGIEEPQISAAARPDRGRRGEAISRGSASSAASMRRRIRATFGGSSPVAASASGRAKRAGMRTPGRVRVRQPIARRRRGGRSGAGSSGRARPSRICTAPRPRRKWNSPAPSAIAASIAWARRSALDSRKRRRGRSP